MRDKFFYDIYFDLPAASSTADKEHIFRLNFFFTKLRQKETALQFIFKEDFTGVYFNRQELRSIFGSNNYSTIIDQMISEGIIQKASFNNQSKTNLNIFKPHDLEPIQHRAEVPLSLPRAVNAVNAYYTGRAKWLSETGKMQMANLRQTHIDITYDRYMQSVIDHYPTYSQIKSETGSTPNTQQDYIRSHQHLWNRIVDFNNTRGKALYEFVTEDNFGNRFHSIITQLPRFIKRQGVIKLQREQTAELDLHQSQPCILAHILEEHDKSNDFSVKFHSEPDIYEYMMNRFSLSSRDSAKKMLFTMLFGKPFGRTHDQFSLMFPEAAKIIKLIKTTKIPENPSGKVHSNMAFKLQRAESTMFRELWSALNTQRIRFLSVHDSVIVQQRQLQQARLTMETVLSNHLKTFKIN